MEDKKRLPAWLTRLSSRRSLMTHGGAMLGASLLVTPDAVSQTSDHPGGAASSAFDVKKFGATGVRKDNATRAFRDAVQACASAGGGVVYVPPGEYTVVTVQLLDHVTLH